MLARVSKCGEIVGRERSCFFFLRGVSSRHIFVVHRSISSCPGISHVRWMERAENNF